MSDTATLSPPTDAATRTKLAVSGMTCASCVGHVTQTLQRTPGVDSARVNLATERATIDHASSLEPRALIAAVEAAGYGATLLVPAPENGRDADHDDARRARDPNA